MPPDSEKSRPTSDVAVSSIGLRSSASNSISSSSSSSSSSIDKYVTLASQKQQNSNEEGRLISDIKYLLPNEICVDGIIYDINTFANHPGGNIFKSFGGNDCSIHYRYNHSTHNTAPGAVHKLLDKNMKRVGRVVDYVHEYKFDTPFERELKKEVCKILKGKEFATAGYMFRTGIYITMFALTSYWWTTTTQFSYTIAILHALTSGFMALNISHDANHGAISCKYIWLNDVLAMANDFVGGTKWLWQQSHNGHHAYTNTERDPDSIASEPAVLFHPYPVGSPKRRWYHNLQALYILPLVSLYWIATVFNPEVVTLREHTTVLAGFFLDNDYYRVRRKYAVLSRIIYIYIYIVRPFQNNGFNWDTFGKIWCFGAIGSMVVAKALFNHNFDESNRVNYNEKEEDGELQDWYKKQAESASTYGGHISGYLAGGLNFQIEHHLFPRMSSAWYPYIAPTVRRVCEKHNVQYTYFPTILHQFVSFSKFIHKSGTCTMSRQWKKIE